MDTHFVYILRSLKHNRHYVGMTQNVTLRLKAHNNREVKSTKSFIPWEVVHTETYKTRTEARSREKYLKSSAGRRWRKNNLEI